MVVRIGVFVDDISMLTVLTPTVGVDIRGVVPVVSPGVDDVTGAPGVVVMVVS